MIKVSVIVPIYGVEKYIERCARSLFEQTLKEIEYIFVDDCTLDESVYILRNVLNDYPDRAQNTQIIKMSRNSGLHNVRKEGLKYATGEFVAHCDSDDWVDKDMYKSMYEFAISGHYDLVKCQFFMSNGKIGKIVRLLNDNKTKEQLVSELLSVKGWNCIWDKLAKRNLYMKCNIIYPETSMWEDFVISTQLVINADNFGVLDKPFYYYYNNPNSICTTKSDSADLKRCENAQINLDIIAHIIQKKYPNCRFKREFLILKYEAKRKLIPMMINYRNYKYWKTTYPEIDIPIITHCLLPRVLYLQYLLVHFRLYPIYKLIIR